MPQRIDPEAQARIAFGKLTTFLPPPSPPRPPVSWETTEAELGIELPAEYKRLYGVYGDVLWCNAFRLLGPSADEWDDLAARTRRARGDLLVPDQMVPQWQAAVPPGVSIEPAQLIQWGAHEGGDYLLWYPGPDSAVWTIILTNVHQSQWFFTAMPVTEFLFAWTTATLDLAGHDYFAVHRYLEGEKPYYEIDPLDGERAGAEPIRIQATTS